MPTDIQNHIVICNWNSRGDKIVRELHSSDAAPESEIVVITSSDVDEAELRTHIGPQGEDSYSKVFFIRSDPQQHSVLQSAKVNEARSIIILSDESSPDPDANSVLIALAIRNICDESELKEYTGPYVVAESADHSKMRHLKEAGVKEVVCAEDYGIGILTQCSLHPKSFGGV